MFAAIGMTFVWLGFVLALSFLEAPLKFRAPGITRQLGLGIGRLVFKALNGAELLLAVLIAVFAVADDGAGALPWLYWPLVALLGAQTAMLHLHMDKRAARLVQGETLPKDHVHLVYIGLELVKVALLVGMGVQLMQEIAG